MADGARGGATLALALFLREDAGAIGAKRAGFAAAIQIRSHLTPEKDKGVSRKYEPDYVIEDIYQVYPLLRGMV